VSVAADAEGIDGGRHDAERAPSSRSRFGFANRGFGSNVEKSLVRPLRNGLT
jgi:hypothetical protein